MCTDTYGVRDFHIPSFREGREEWFEFQGGYDFEQFMFGFDSSGMKLDQRYRYKSFYADLKEAVSQAKENGLTYEGLINRGCKPFCVYLFEEIRNLFSIKDRSKVQMYITLGTPLDLIHGVDMVISMSNRFVTIDTTIDPFGKDRNRPKFKNYSNHMIFSHYNLSQKETSKFAKKVLSLLTKKDF